MPKAYLIDGNSLAYRAFYALPDTMRTSSGITTNAIYGFTTMLLKILDDKPELLAIAFDLPAPTFRHKEYKEYKATRQKAPPTLIDQMAYIKQTAEAFNIPIFETPGFEADDIIGTLAKKLENSGYDVTIFSGDLDPLQLVNEHIKLLTTRKGITDTVLYGTKEVEERYDGLKPEQLIDYKALKGDASDNIPGVPKVGEKTAIELLKEFGTLDAIYENIEKIKKPALKENLKNNRHLADLSKMLGTISTDAPVGIDELKKIVTDWDKVIPLFKLFEFESLVKKYGKNAEQFNETNQIERKREEISKLDYKTVLNEKSLDELIEILSSADAFAFDLETTSLNTREAEIVGISFSIETKTAYYIPIAHIGKVKVLEKLSPLFLSDKLKIGHNLKYDIEVLSTHNIKANAPLFDTMVAAYLIDPTANKYSLKSLAKQFLGKDMIQLSELIGKDAQYSNFSEVPIDFATDYAGSDADATFSLFKIFNEELIKNGLGDLFFKCEMPLLEILIALEETGVFIDKEKLHTMSVEIDSEMKDLERNIFAIAGETFNLNSPKQLSVVLFEKLKIPIVKKTKTGYSTDSEVLEELSGKFEIAEKLLKYRQLSKLKSTYIDVLPTLTDPKTNRIHAKFNQTITATGRLSSSDPNLQNIPAKGELGKKTRRAFVPQEKGWLILAADYSQIELRILAHLSHDPAMVEAFKKAEDIHQAVADELGIPRDSAKTVNFGIVYGISDFGLSKSLKIKRTEAAQYINKYFERHKGIKDFIDKTINEAKDKGFVKTMLGRIRPIPDILNPNFSIKSFAERTAINTPVQGTAADMIKLAMVKIYKALKAQQCRSYMILQVHDELVFECPKDEIDQVRNIVKAEMENILPLDVPVKVDIGVGESWGEAK
ncbi:MAG: DNA polymerase I [Candidatus Saganbacteria bacterium]|uniref:DNA polymerase I n=1 Tax=Candidatus Saganbacteria bacterium TaxID=2575572 RepID=A0A833NWV6_UNCSA|nr:MAG: DNA polymerase I [Candidatus Saganbacteria bacterium]